MNHLIVADLGFGDAGKGTVVDWLCSRGPRGVDYRNGGRVSRPVHAVVRFNGGAQAAHNVVLPDGRHHTFAQFGSGTFTRGMRTHLSRFMLVDPVALAAEADQLARLGVGDALARLTVDGDALLTTPYHQAANRAREQARGTARHGSCGMGIGETMAYAIDHPGAAPRVADCLAPRLLRRRLSGLWDWVHDVFPGVRVPSVEACLDAFTAFGECVRVVDSRHLAGLLRGGPVVFEGAQGVLLDEWHGFHPYTTWSTTTFANAETLLAEAGTTGTRLGVVRTYMTRHGAGPFVTEDPALTTDLPDRHNSYGRWQGAFRVGHLDLVALRYALAVTGGADALAVTHLDVARARRDLLVCRAYDLDGHRVERLVPGWPADLERQAVLTDQLLTARPWYEPLGDPVATIEHGLGVPVLLRSSGPTADDKQLDNALNVSPWVMGER